MLHYPRQLIVVVELPHLILKKSSLNFVQISISKKASIGCRRTTATHVDTPKACVHLIAAKGAAQGVSYYVTNYNYQKR